MPISHPRRVPVQRLPLQSQSTFLEALSLHRPADATLRQCRFVQSFILRKESISHQRRQIMAHVTSVRTHKPARSTRPPGAASPNASPCASISARRLGCNMPSLRTPISFTAHRDSPPVLPLETPLPNLIPPSKFSSPFTPANQVLHTPFHPPEPHKVTPSKRHRNRNWQWSPVLFSHVTTSPQVEENMSPAPAHTPTSPYSPLRNLTRRLSLVAPPTSSVHVPRRLSYSQACASPWTPESRHSHALASPVLIRSTLWTPASPVASRRYQLGDLQFSPFHVSSF
ncbi:hypothetical protein DFH07DRAFT_840906 [Mycena maculata]|uniref:Uncharacterized protein n=1 Tax=Mycena maculata TaxID=230809 RepID=A0AAD7IC04_9AGAR|nr:hypothetical protein DFH07DRAFT_840906 [Mycena maculata]